jgi:hypothetical protein
MGFGPITTVAVADSSTNGQCVALNLGGTIYYIPCSSVAPT